MSRISLLCAALVCMAGFFVPVSQHRLVAYIVVGFLAAYGVAGLRPVVVDWARRHKDLQFSMRELLALVLLCCVGLTAWKAFLRPIYEQRQFLAAVADLGGSSRAYPDRVLVTLAGPQITDDALQRLAAMSGRKKVTELFLCRSSTTGPLSITDEGMVYLTKFPMLTEVGVTDCPGITDVGFEKLQAAPSLKAIHAYGCRNITDEGVDWLAERRDLKRLNLINTKVTSTKIAELERALPICRIFQNRP